MVKLKSEQRRESVMGKWNNGSIVKSINKLLSLIILSSIPKPSYQRRIDLS